MVGLGEGTDFLEFLNALAAKKVFYDPGMKVTFLNGQKPHSTRRSQFRVRARDVRSLYYRFSHVDLDNM